MYVQGQRELLPLEDTYPFRRRYMTHEERGALMSAALVEAAGMAEAGKPATVCECSNAAGRGRFIAVEGRVRKPKLVTLEGATFIAQPALRVVPA